MEKEIFLSDVEKKVHKLQNTLSQLQRVRSKTKNQVDKYKVVIHPIRRLPHEILAEIFGFCVHDGGESDIFLDGAVSSLVTQQPPWSLAQVCSRWRGVCLSLPSIWSNITLHFDPTPARTPQAQQQRKALTFLLGHQLARSGNHPLSVNMISPDTFPQDHFLLPILLPSSSRWRQLIAKTSTRSFDCLAPIEGFLQNLEVLILHSRGRPTNDEPRTLFRYAPNLRKIITYTQTALGLQFPYETITEFRNFDVEPAQGSRTTNNLEILRRFQWLRTLKLNCRTDGMVHQYCSLQYLTHIELCGELSSNGVSALLSNLRLPSLKSLTIMGKLDLDKIINFLHQSQCELEELSIKSDILTGEDCFALLENVGSIQRLSVACAPTVITPLLSELQQDSGDVELKIEEIEDDDDDVEEEDGDPDLTIISTCTGGSTRNEDGRSRSSVIPTDSMAILPRLKELEVTFGSRDSASSELIHAMVRMLRKSRPWLQVTVNEVGDDALEILLVD